MVCLERTSYLKGRSLPSRGGTRRCLNCPEPPKVRARTMHELPRLSGSRIAKNTTLNGIGDTRAAVHALSMRSGEQAAGRTLSTDSRPSLDYDESADGPRFSSVHRWDVQMGTRPLTVSDFGALRRPRLRPVYPPAKGSVLKMTLGEGA
jgi:hypothetical protein